MPRYNIKQNDKYMVYSTISSCMIQEFDSFEELQQWRLTEYGKAEFKNEKTWEELNGNKMELWETIMWQAINGNALPCEIIKYFNMIDDGEKEKAMLQMIEALRDN